MLIKEEKGAALVLTILFLLVGTILLGGLFVSVRGYLNTSVHKEGISKAFHAADSGVELVKANLDDSIFDSMVSGDFLSIYEDGGSLKMEFVDSEELIDFNSFHSNFSDDYKFTIKVKDAANKTLVSTGKYISSGGEFTENIQFQIKNVGNVNKNFNIKKNNGLDNDEDHYNIDGKKDIEDHIGVVDWEKEGINSFKSFAAEFIAEKFIDKDNENKFNKDKFDKQYKNTLTTLTNEELNNDKNKNILVEGNLELGKDLIIQDSIIVVDGNITNVRNKTTIINSVFIVSGYADITGAASNEVWENPIFLIYGINNGAKHDTYLNISGTGEGFNVNFDNLPNDFQGGKTISNWEQN